MEYFPTFGLKFFGKSGGKYTSPMEHLDTIDLQGLYTL